MFSTTLASGHTFTRCLLYESGCLRSFYDYVYISFTIRFGGPTEVYIGVVIRYTGFLYGTASPPGGFLRLTVASVASYAYIRAFLIRQFASAPPFGKPLTVTFIAFSRARRTVRNRKQLSTAYQCLQALGISPDHGVISSSLGHFNPTPCFCMHRVVHDFRSHRRCILRGWHRHRHTLRVAFCLTHACICISVAIGGFSG